MLDFAPHACCIRHIVGEDAQGGDRACLLWGKDCRNAAGGISGARTEVALSWLPVCCCPAWTTQNARLTEKAPQYIAQRTTLERAAPRCLRNQLPGLNSHELVQEWIDRITGAAPTDVPDPVEHRRGQGHRYDEKGRHLFRFLT